MLTCRGGHKMPGPWVLTAQQDVKDADHPIGGGCMVGKWGSLSAIKCLVQAIKCQE